MTSQNISKPYGGSAIKLKNKVQKTLIIAILLFFTLIFFMGIYYFVDVVLNGTFADWFDNNYMQTYDTLSPDGTPIIVHKVNWSNIKELFMQILVYGAIALVILGVVIFRYYKKHVRSAIDQSKKMLENETSRKNDMIAYLAHDLKTPLTSVVGYLSLLDEASDMPAEQRAKYIHISLDKALRLEKLINEFFDITRFNLQQITLDKEATDLHYMLLQMSDEFYPILKEHGNTIELQASENLTAYVDAAKLARVFNNILKNAIAYSYPDTPILITARETENTFTITFQNKGTTIPGQKLETIFEKFFRLDDARTSNTGGAGLGLAIAKEIVTLHGGTISAASENEITTFTVVLPGFRAMPD